ncbi:MAG TPA: cupin domain-containing protein [Candidatus Methylacidiphilales bacterium]|jgi:transcriptional regulator with XRE-family HTH domain|nr:cupin domain-containing protein [Candidatus Methylacidiphilales bacterium]
MTKSKHLVKDQLAAFGDNLKQQRQRKGWTLEELATRSGLSKTFLSRLESGDRQASIAAVLTLSEVFGLSLAELFETHVPLDPCLIVRKSETEAREAHGLTYLPLSRAGHHFNLRPLRVTVSPDRTGNEHYRHEGEEWIYVLSGAITLSLAGETYDLDTGDAVHFDSRLPHRVMTRGRKAAEILLVASPLPLERRSSATPFNLSNARRAIPSGASAEHGRDLSPLS